MLCGYVSITMFVLIHRITSATCLPVLFMYEAWGRKYRGEGELMRILDDETGLEVQPVAIDRITGAEIGTRPFHIVQPKDSENITQDGGSNDIVGN